MGMINVFEFFKRDKMKRYIFSGMIGFWMLCGNISAQQIPISTLFVENPFLFNPAVAGTDKGFKLRMDNRFQWMGFEDAPITNILSAYGPHKKRNIGYGGNIGYDATGPTSRFLMNGAFATNFFVAQDIRISMGLGLGFIQSRADGTRFELDAPGTPQVPDPNAPREMMASFLPDASVGVYVYHHDWYGGISAQQLFNNNVKYAGEDSKRNRLKTHFYGFGGYRFYVSDRDHWIIEPAVLLKKVVAVPLQLDLTARVIYMQRFWGGLNFRNTFESFEDISLMLGYIHERRIHIAIAYDYTLAKIGRYNAGTIELVVGYNFTELKKGR